MAIKALSREKALELTANRVIDIASNQKSIPSRDHVILATTEIENRGNLSFTRFLNGITWHKFVDQVMAKVDQILSGGGVNSNGNKNSTVKDKSEG